MLLARMTGLPYLYQAPNGDTKVKRLTKDPEDLCCMISGSLYENPVVLHGDGETYEKDDIQRWTRNNPTSPKNRKRLPTPVPRHSEKRVFRHVQIIC